MMLSKLLPGCRAVKVLAWPLFLTSSLVIASAPAQIVIPATLPATDSLDSWLATEVPYALDGILNNVGADGAKAIGAYSGSVIASPSKRDPNYFYTWTRDSALTIKCLVDIFVVSGDPLLQATIQDYISSQAFQQTVPNPSGDLYTGGLGEPKFEADGSQFTGSWGRPQRDGPALRATALVAYANWLIETNQTSLVDSIIWPIVQNDLSYVTEHWNSSTYDLWEETNSSSFFTTAVQHQALIHGSLLAQKLNHFCPNCLSQTPQLLCFLQSYWSPTEAFILANHNTPRSAKDANSILASIYTFDPASAAAATCDDLTFQPCSPRALANHKAVTDVFRDLYHINKGIPPGRPVAVGRYPEDVYQGGHPWYLCTLAAAQQLYHAVGQWKRIGVVDVTQTSLAFFKDLYTAAEPGSYPRSTSTYNEILAAVMAYADGYMRVVAKYAPASGTLAEQFSRTDGSPLSARDLTWSYAALLTADAARRDALSAAVTATGSTEVKRPPTFPEKCIGSSEKGSYAPATNTSWPALACHPSGIVSVRFNVMVETVFGEGVFVVGSVGELGAWDGERAVHMRADEYGVVPLWYVRVKLEVGREDEEDEEEEEVEYKFIKRDRGGKVVWENGLNRRLRLDSGRCGTATVNAVWR